RPELVIRWMQQLCDVLWYLHSRQPPVIYRDMKPANVMLKPDGDVVVIDFGTARESRGGNSEDTVCLGTRGYAAPEQFGGSGETDERTDIYTLGATMYHLLTGCSPADTDFILYPVGELRPELKDSGLEKVVAKCCEHRRENRYQSAAELLDALTHVHDFDLEVLKRDKKRMRIFLLPAILCLLSVLAMCGFRTMKDRTIQNSFEQSLRRARKAETFAEAIGDFQNALAIQPAEPSGYEALLGKIVSDSDREFSEEDRRVLRELLTAKPAEGEGQSCAEVFEQKNPAGYDWFRFRLGVMYFQYFGSGSYRYAAAELQDLQESPYLGERERSLSGSLYLISCVVLANASGLGSSRVFGETGKGWAEVFAEFMGFLGVPEAAGEKCGNSGAAFAMYRTFANLVESRIKNFREAGVTGKQLEQVLDAGESYIQKEEGGETDQAVRKEAKEALERARMTVRTVYGGG
ncbi:MAG: serine/threonine protein kinase, partial [Lachnospiraceae bacterium]